MTVSADDRRASTVAFADVEVDLGQYAIRRGGEAVAVEPQVFDVLCYLIEHRERVVTKEELLDNVWGDRFVSESALTTRIKSARQAVGDDGRRQAVIRTSHGRGYQFVAEVTIDLTGAATSTPVETSALAPVVRVPIPPRPLIGRTRELEAVSALLGANRLVTIVGPGGVGKTRLANEIASRWSQRSAETVVFVALASVDAPGDVLLALRDALGLDSGPAGDVARAIVEAISARPALLVFDNFEQVLDAATEVAALVESLSSVRVLVTSRERLGLTGERVVELEPFALASDGASRSPAIEFFDDAVRSAGSEIDVGGDDDEHVEAICSALDGLPLAMELAAAQTRYYPVAYLRSLLESSAMTVADRARDRPPRHQTMDSTIAWSHRLLTPQQQRLFAFMSVFNGSWTLDAADTMLAVDEPGAAARDLLALVDKSLVRRTDGPDGTPRFTMLRLLREFAAERLDATGERGEAHRRHAAVVAERVRGIEAGRWARGGDEWVGLLAAEHGDVLAALAWAFVGGDPGVGCEIVRILGYWWYRTGRIAEGRLWVDHALEHDVGDDSVTAWVHSTAGLIAAYEGHAEVSVEHFERALELARRTGDRRLESLTLCHLGATPTSADRSTATLLASVERGLELGRELGTLELVTHGLTTLGELSRANGEPQRAEQAYREALGLSTEVDNASYLAVNTLNLGHALSAQGRPHEALEAYGRGIDLAAGVGSRIMMAWNLSGIAGAQQALGRHEEAARLAGAAQAALDALGANHGPVDQPLHDASQGEVRAALGDETYEACFEDGRRLALDGGVALAREAMGRVQSDFT